MQVCYVLYINGSIYQTSPHCTGSNHASWNWTDRQTAKRVWWLDVTWVSNHCMSFCPSGILKIHHWCSPSMESTWCHKNETVPWEATQMGLLCQTMLTVEYEAAMHVLCHKPGRQYHTSPWNFYLHQNNPAGTASPAESSSRLLANTRWWEKWCLACRWHRTEVCVLCGVINIILLTLATVAQQYIRGGGGQGLKGNT